MADKACLASAGTDESPCPSEGTTVREVIEGITVALCESHAIEYDADPGDAPHECAYCGMDQWYLVETPALDDDETWETLARGHAPGCEWIVTRAHRLGIGTV